MLIQLAFKVESTAEYRAYSSETNAPQGHAIGMDNGVGGKKRKRARPDTNLYRGGISASTASGP